MSRKEKSRLILWLLASTAVSSIAAAQEPSGTAVRVTPDADASGITGNRILEAPGDVYQGDRIVTGANGQAQIQFVDDTRFVVGPNSRVTIDEFVFNPDRTAQSVVLNAAKGTFRFISGRSPSEAYAVNTPTMTIGVRGTLIDVRVLGSGYSYATWRQGSGVACVATECRNVAAGQTVGATPDGEFANFRPGELQQLLTTLANTLGPLGPGFGSPPVGTPDPATQDPDRNESVETEVEVPPDPY